MADADDKLDFCKQALGELGTRSTITSLDPPDGSQEAFYCNLFFNGTRDQILRAAHWSFAGRSDVMTLWKAAPGTPENPAIPSSNLWSNRDPAPGWLYSYVHAAGVNIIQVRRVYGQQQARSDSSNIMFYGDNIRHNRQDCYPFEISSDVYDQQGNRLYTTTTAATITISGAGSGYRGGDYINMTQSGAEYGQPLTVLVVSANAVGSVLFAEVADGGSFIAHTALPFTQLSTTGAGTGFSCGATFTAHDPVLKVVLTNAQAAIMDFTTSDIGVQDYDSLFGDAFMLALEGKLALALLGDRAIYQAKLQEANNSIINARVRDGNEGLTTYDHVPDWLQVRGVSSMSSPTGGWYNPPYGPLFAV